MRMRKLAPKFEILSKLKCICAKSLIFGNGDPIIASRLDAAKGSRPKRRKTFEQISARIPKECSSKTKRDSKNRVSKYNSNTAETGHNVKVVFWTGKAPNAFLWCGSREKSYRNGITYLSSLLLERHEVLDGTSKLSLLYTTDERVRNDTFSNRTNKIQDRNFTPKSYTKSAYRWAKRKNKITGPKYENAWTSYGLCATWSRPGAILARKKGQIFRTSTANLRFSGIFTSTTGLKSSSILTSLDDMVCIE